MNAGFLNSSLKIPELISFFCFLFKNFKQNYQMASRCEISAQMCIGTI